MGFGFVAQVSLVGNGKASVAVDVVVKEASPPLPEVKALTPPPPLVEVVEEVVAGAGPDMELRCVYPPLRRLCAFVHVCLCARMFMCVSVCVRSFVREND